MPLALVREGTPLCFGALLQHPTRVADVDVFVAAVAVLHGDEMGEERQLSQKIHQITWIVGSSS